MNRIGPDEIEIIGGWQERNGALVPDGISRRIEEILSSGQLIEVGRSSDGWSVLYRDVNDGRYWERTYPHGELHGGWTAFLSERE